MFLRKIPSGHQFSIFPELLTWPGIGPLGAGILRLVERKVALVTHTAQEIHDFKQVWQQHVAQRSVRTLLDVVRTRGVRRLVVARTRNEDVLV